MPSHSLDGKKIDPKHATPKSKSKANKTKKIFVGGVSQETSADEVKAYFSQFGKVEEAVMLMDQQTKRHRGFGFVTFENEDVVDRVCEIHFHTIKNKKVECKKAQPKEAVQAANTAALLGKRVILSNLGIPTLAQSQAAATGHLPGLTNPAVSGLPGLIQQTPSMAALAAAQSQAAALGYGKILQAAGAAGAHQGTPSQHSAVVTSSSGGGPQPAGLPSALSSFRYAPYPMPASAVSALSASQAVQQAAALAAQQQQAAVVAQQQPPSAGQPPQQQQHQQQSASSASAAAQQAAAVAAVAQHQAAANNSGAPSVNGSSLTALTSNMPTVSLALASNQAALQTFAQSGAHAAVIPSVTASGGLAAPGLTTAGAAGQLAAAQAAAGTPLTAAQAQAAAQAAAVNPYSGYSLTNVDMSSFQGVDWNSVYGMGMYV